MPHRIVGRVGRRGAFLLVLSMAMALLGWTILDLTPVTIHALHIFGHMSPLELGLTWLIPAGLAFAGAWVRKPDTWDGLAFTLGWLVWFLWGAAYVLSWMPFHDLGMVQALRPAAFYWCIAGLVLVASGWTENRSVLVPKGDDPDGE